MDRRRILRAVGTVLGTAGLAGCLERAGGPGGGTPSPDDATTDPTEGTQSPDPTDTTDDSSDYDGEREADPDLPIEGENRHDVTHTVGLAVSRGESSVHEESYELAPGVERELYNLREADPDGIEQFTVVATLDGRTESVDVRTSDCYGSVVVATEEDGELFLTYSVC